MTSSGVYCRSNGPWLVKLGRLNQCKLDHALEVDLRVLLPHDLQNVFAVLLPVRLQVAKESLGEAQGRRAIGTAPRASEVAPVLVAITTVSVHPHNYVAPSAPTIHKAFLVCWQKMLI